MPFPELIRHRLLSRNAVSLALVVAGLLAVVLYLTCLEACTGVAGTVAGVDLTYVGIGFMGLVGVGLLCRRERLVFWLLSAGVGAEVFLIAHQVRTGEYCPFCLGFGAVVVALFLLQFRAAYLKTLALALPLGFLLILLSFAAAPLPSFGAESPARLPIFGVGPVEVRLYTDYFCEPCRGIEADLNKKLIDVVEQGRAQVTIIDVPLHPPTPMYARYFLAMLDPDTGIREAIKGRTLLFEAAARNLTSPAELEDFLRGQSYQLRPDARDRDLTVFNRYLAEDKVRSTPTLVIRDGKESRSYTGSRGVLNGMARLLGS